MNQEEAVRQAIADYYRAFSTLDVQAILPHFSEPALFMGPPGVFPVHDHAALTAILTPLIADLKSKDYGRSELDLQEVKSLGSATAFITGIALRYKADGNILERVPISYLLHKFTNGWKISTMVIH